MTSTVSSVMRISAPVPNAVNRTAASAAEIVGPLVAARLGDELPVRIEFWDGSSIGPDQADALGTARLRSANALRRILWSPNQLGLCRAYVAGDIELEGDLYAILGLRSAIRRNAQVGWSDAPTIAAAARQLGVFGRPLPPPPEEAQLTGWRHSIRRDAAAIRHHYDVGNDFYALVLGPSMTYSCARFKHSSMELADAQAAKHDLVCRKLGLADHPGGRLLDVGCGWGSMAIHAATHFDVSVVGITISASQAEMAQARVVEAGVADRVDIRLQDYRHLGGERFDAISSIGMSEHVGAKRLGQYFEILRAALRPQGRLLNHAISSVGGSKLDRASFIARYVFPDGELIDVGDTILAMERAGFEVRDAESLREHYAHTLRAWVSNLETNWEAIVAAVGAARARIWRLYMAGSAIAFTDGDIAIHQVLGVVPTADGVSGMPPTRNEWG